MAIFGNDWKDYKDSGPEPSACPLIEIVAFGFASNKNTNFLNSAFVAGPTLKMFIA